jgi:hypothetical protein
VAIVLNTDIEDAVQRDAVPCQGVVGRERRGA